MNAPRVTSIATFGVAGALMGAAIACALGRSFAPYLWGPGLGVGYAIGNTIGVFVLAEQLRA